MKRFSYIAFGFLAALLTVSCNTVSPDNNSEVSLPFSINPTKLEFSFEGGEKELEFQAPGDWTITSGAESWCTVSPSSGTGDGKVTVTAVEFQDEQDRETKLLFACNGLTIVVTVSQTGNHDVFTVTPTSVEIGPGEEDFTITVRSTEREYDVEIVDDWLSIASRMKNNDKEVITFRSTSIEPTPEATPRTGVISVCTKDGSCIPVMVTQEGCKPSVKVLGMRFTATWCGYCPYMDEGFHKAAEQNEDFIFVTFHASSGYPLYFSPDQALMTDYRIGGFPTGVIGGWKELSNTTNSNTLAKNILKIVTDFQGRFDYIVEIKPELTVSGNTVTASATVTSYIDSDYKIVAILMESGIVQAQTYYPASGGSRVVDDFVHDNIARKLLTDNIRGDAFQIGTGESKSFTWETSADNSWNTDNLSVVVYLYKEYGENTSLKGQNNYPNTYIANSAIAEVK